VDAKLSDERTRAKSVDCFLTVVTSAVMPPHSWQVDNAASGTVASTCSFLTCSVRVWLSRPQRSFLEYQSSVLPQLHTKESVDVRRACCSTLCSDPNA
jgi:hypothetical protein